MGTKTRSKADVEWAERKLREIIAQAPDGQTPEIGTVTIHGRGMTDHVECFAVSDGQIVRVTYWVALVTRSRMTEKGIPMGGGGYDKAYQIVEDLHTRLSRI